MKSRSRRSELASSISTRTCIRAIITKRRLTMLAGLSQLLHRLFRLIRHSRSTKQMFFYHRCMQRLTKSRRSPILSSFFLRQLFKKRKTSSLQKRSAIRYCERRAQNLLSKIANFQICLSKDRRKAISVISDSAICQNTEEGQFRSWVRLSKRNSH